MQKYLVSSKKSSTFAVAFEKQVRFYFLSQREYLKSESSMKVLIFLRSKKTNWKIDTISVVQELKLISLCETVELFDGAHRNMVPVTIHFNKSVILSYLIISLYNEEFDPGSGWTLATGLTHASRGAAREKLAFPGGDRRTGA